MATYYVRKSGNDGNSGTSPSSAWLTITKAANTVAAGDTVYVGAGVYRELVTMVASGSSGSPISFIADVDGKQTGDAGLVIVSARDADNAVESRTCCLNPNAKTFIRWRGFVLDGCSGSNAAIKDSPSGDPSYAGWEIEDCVVIAGNSNTAYAMDLDWNQATAPSPSTGIRIRRCLFLGGVRFQWDGNASGNKNIDAVFENCAFITSSNQNLFFFDRITTGTYSPGGISFLNCLFLGGTYGIQAENTVAALPISVYNCLFIGQVSYALYRASGESGGVVEDYCRFHNTSARSGVSAGANSSSVGMLGMLGALADLPLWRFLGWSPYRPFEPMAALDGAFTSNVIDVGSATYAPEDDLYGKPRPMMRNVDDVGPVETRARAEKETSTVRTGANALRFDGAGYHEILLPVSAVATTVSVYGRYDSNYAGNKPKLEVVNIPGGADQSATMTGGANAWEQLSVNFTPTASGICRVRLISQDTSANGKCFFDDLLVVG